MEDKETYAMTYVDGIDTDSGSSEMMFGSIFHLCSETYIKAWHHKSVGPTKALTASRLAAEKYHDEYIKKHRSYEAQTAAYKTQLQAYNIFRAYAEHYGESFTSRKWIAREQTFCTPHTTSGTEVNLRGKRDGVLLGQIQDGPIGRILWETKTKSRIDHEHIGKQIKCDAQTLFYLNAMRLESMLDPSKKRPVGFYYDVVKRPSIRVKKKQTLEEYGQECYEKALESPKDYFALFEQKVDLYELEEYDQKFLTKQIRAFFEWWDSLPGASPEKRAQSPLHYLNLSALVTPYRISPFYDILAGYKTANNYDKKTTPFPELAYDPIPEEILEQLQLN